MPTKTANPTDQVAAILAGDGDAVMTFLEVAQIFDKLPATPAEAGGQYRSFAPQIAAAEAATVPIAGRLDALRGLASALAAELAEVPDLASTSDAVWSRRAGLVLKLTVVEGEVPRAMTALRAAHDEAAGLRRAQTLTWIGCAINARAAVEFKLANKLPVRRRDLTPIVAGVMDLPAGVVPADDGETAPARDERAAAGNKHGHE